jgi:RsiW-degrading membrane proteinase PrsW (M82 family)
MPHYRVPAGAVKAPSRSELTRGRRLPRGAWLAVLVAGTGLFELLRQALIATHNPNLVPALILVGAIVVPLTFVVFVYGRRLPYDVPGWVLTVTAMTGGVIGIVVAGTLEYATVRSLGTLPMIGVGLIEETAKLIIPALILLSGRYRRPADGLLIGVASGAGFAVLETMGYSFVVLILSHGSLSAVDGVLLLRGLLSPAAHMAWTGLAAAALWNAAARGWSWPAVLSGIGVFLLAVGLHAAWDSIGTITGYVILAGVGLGALTVVTHQMRVRADYPPPAARRRIP